MAFDQPEIRRHCPKRGRDKFSQRLSVHRCGPNGEVPQVNGPTSDGAGRPIERTNLEQIHPRPKE